MKYIKFFKELNNKDVPIVGGKNASIGEMFQGFCKFYTPKTQNCIFLL